MNEYVCGNCGGRFRSDMTSGGNCACPWCGLSLPAGIPPPIPGVDPDTLKRQLYDAAPWYRRNSFASVLMLIWLAGMVLVPIVISSNLRRPDRELPRILSLATGGLAMLALCLLVVTGPIYLPKLSFDWKLKQWGLENKIVAWLILAGSIAAMFGLLKCSAGATP